MNEQDDDRCIWTLPKGTLIWAETKDAAQAHLNGHKVPFTLEADTQISGHPNMLRYVGAIQPKPITQVPLAVSGVKPQQAATDDNGRGQ
jgi:hypothetical protein